MTQETKDTGYTIELDTGDRASLVVINDSLCARLPSGKIEDTGISVSDKDIDGVITSAYGDPVWRLEGR